MVTKNFKNLLAMMLQAGSNLGNLRMVAVTGRTRYANGVLTSFPNSVTKAVTLDANAAGISIGTGATAATEEDYQLEAPITSGVTMTLTQTSYGTDSPNLPYVQYDITVTNNSGSTLTVTEVGYKQTLSSVKYPDRNTDTATYVFMLDRTVLDTAVVIAAGDAGIIQYKLRTIPEPSKMISNVKIVSFTWGTDAEIADMIDAARLGTIDLQTDGGWRVGDMRKIHVDAWTGGNSVFHAAEDLYIVISQFGDYNSCGSLFQFDFVDCCTGGQRMNSSGTTTGGYAATEMYTTTLPALVLALPSWLQSRLKTFSVLASAGGSSLSTIDTVENNKLALRSEIEIFGTRSYSQEGEGTQVDLYKQTSYKTKAYGPGGSTANWWERSAYSASNFCYVSTSGSAGSYTASSAYGVSPFGCI